MTPVVRRERHPYARLQSTEVQLPDLVEIQLNSFNKFLDEGIQKTFTEISPIEDYTGSYAVEFGEGRFEEPPVSVEECMSKDKTYAAPLFVKVRFIIKETGAVEERDNKSQVKDLLGPYATRAEAEHALESARARTEAWDREDREWEER